MSNGKRPLFYNNDDGVCQYRQCGRTIPDGISIQLCDKHLRHAYAAYLIANGEPNDTRVITPL